MVGAIVLAAGESRRMGTQKLLLPFGAGTVVEHVVDRLLQSTVDETVVVTGQDAGRVAELLAGRPVRVEHNPNYREGMLSSVRRGVAAAPDTWTGIMVVLGDQPLLEVRVVDGLLAEFARHERDIVVPEFEGKRGHPMVFPALFRYEVLTEFDGEGLRGLLRAHSGRVRELKIDASSVLADMDVPEDYQEALRQLRERQASE